MKVLKDFAPGEIVFTSEPMDGEVREVFYLLDKDRECSRPSNVAIARLGIVQGNPETPEQPRYVRIAKIPCRDPGETDGRIPCRSVGDGSLFYSRVKLGTL